MSLLRGILCAMIFLLSNVRADGVPNDCTQLLLGIAPTWDSMHGRLQLFERAPGGK